MGESKGVSPLASGRVAVAQKSNVSAISCPTSNIACRNFTHTPNGANSLLERYRKIQEQCKTAQTCYGKNKNTLQTFHKIKLK